MESKPQIGIIGGSGVYKIPGLVEVERLELKTPFGKPSAPLVVGSLDGSLVVFLARHGPGHILSPTEVNYRANIYALKSLGVERILSVTACGSLREDFRPGDMVIPDQLVDLTKNRSRTFFENGLVAHVSVAEPFCPAFSAAVHDAVSATGAPTHLGGTFVTIEGPRFSTRAESNIFRSWGISIIGMTASPEAFLAREAEMCYAAMAHVTDYDVWHISEEPVTADMVFKTISASANVAQEAIRNLVTAGEIEMECECHTALASALTTHHEAIEPLAVERLSLLVGKYIHP
ncbi:MAG TPA: S-methyl-5'-thioadenosine phosphorylase [Anaerolineales bacterium]|nr:S-methyl-5'-thioadenosine phosphorylase [Anaerolineales bacterium]